MSHVPTVLKSDRSVFDEMLLVDDNANMRGYRNVFVRGGPTLTNFSVLVDEERGIQID